MARGKGAGGKAAGGRGLARAMKTLAGVSTATLTTILLKKGYKSCFIKGVQPLNPEASGFVARAFTLRMIPMREDKYHPDLARNPEYPQRKAAETCPPGHALVIDGRGEVDAGILGDIIITRLIKRGVAAVVTDGAMRDSRPISEMSIPVFCRAVAAPSSYMLHYAIDLQTPIACGGAAVFPGDVLVGDEDGVVVLPAAMAPELAELGAAQERLERFISQKVAGGAPIVGVYPPNEKTLKEYAAWKGK